MLALRLLFIICQQQRFAFIPFVRSFGRSVGRSMCFGFCYFFVLLLLLLVPLFSSYAELAVDLALDAIPRLVWCDELVISENSQ